MGEVRFIAGAADFESKANGEFTIVITATSRQEDSDLPPAPELTAADLSSTQRVVITLNDVNEAPTGLFVNSPSIAGPGDADNPVTTGALGATDPDAGSVFTFRVVADSPGGEETDSHLFTVNAAGQLQFTGDGDDTQPAPRQVSARAGRIVSRAG